MKTLNKVNRWATQLERCQEQSRSILTLTQQTGCSAAFLAHCNERLEFFAAREVLLTKQLLRLESELMREMVVLQQELAAAAKKYLDTIYEAVKRHGKVILTKSDDGSVQLTIPGKTRAENKQMALSGLVPDKAKNLLSMLKKTPACDDENESSLLC